ncbi:5-methyltetrahydropteroyltriglutamate--homocysteine methyltransferase, partial [Tanacetum coccineum]
MANTRSYLHGYGVCRQHGYAVLGIGQTRFLVKSWRRYAVSLISEEEYVKAIKEEIYKVVQLQEELHIDVLVHGAK